jgi:ferric-dicitrate binding protein FerR (iron transport regulator)
MTNRTVWCDNSVYRAATEPADNGDEQARRRAARWHAWLKSPECTFQDRENFERWCSDVTNAAAYVAFCGDLVGADEFVDSADEAGYMNPVHTSSVHSQRLEADQR